MSPTRMALPRVRASPKASIRSSSAGVKAFSQAACDRLGENCWGGSDIGSEGQVGGRKIAMQRQAKQSGSGCVRLAIMIPRTFFGWHYALAVVAIIFVALLAAAGLRSTPGVLMVPWGQAFGWSRQTISLAAAVGIFLFGLTGPFAAAAMQRFGIRATMMVALAMMAVSSAISLFMTAPWQLVLTWGLISGIGSGCVSTVLAATIVNRWFVTNRGLVMGLFAASTSTGTLVFIPALSAIAESHGWRPVVLCVAVAMAALIPFVYFLLPERPADVGAQPFGADANH